MRMRQIANILAVRLPATLGAQDATWVPAVAAGGLIDCTPSVPWRVRIGSSEATKTPNNAGDNEEWRISLRGEPLGSNLAAFCSRVTTIWPRDRIPATNPASSHYGDPDDMINLPGNLDSDIVIGGGESDAWPNPVYATLPCASPRHELLRDRALQGLERWARRDVTP